MPRKSQETIKKEKKSAYDQQYQKDNYKQMRIAFSNANDSDIWEWLSKQKNKNAYLKALIRADMEKNQ